MPSDDTFTPNPWADRDSRFFDEELPDPMEDRLLQKEAMAHESEDLRLRPVRLADYFGQARIRENLRVFIEASKKREDALDHVLLYGPPGLGKTTLAGIIAHELNVNIRVTSGPAITKGGDLAAILTNLEPHDVLFIDEIHRLNHQVEEVLYPAMEDYCLDIMIGKGPSARSIRIDLPPFTLIGATTRAGLLSAPLRDRFGMLFRLELYAPDELMHILNRDAELLRIAADPDGLRAIASRSRGTPRIAIRLLKRVRDFAEVRGTGSITARIADEALEALEIDHLGLDSTDLRVLRAMAVNYAGGPVGLETLAAVTGEDAGTIEDVLEPYLMQIGFVAKTPRGRILTDSAWQHLGLTPPDERPATHAPAEAADPAEPVDRSPRALTLDDLLGDDS